jgi:hypothetical protein
LARISIEVTIESERNAPSSRPELPAGFFGEFDPRRPGEKSRLVILSPSDRGAVEFQEDHDENSEIAELVLGVIRCSRIAGNPWNGE